MNEGGEEDEEESDEEEPSLRHARIEGTVPRVLKGDYTSAMSVSGNRLMGVKFIAFVVCSVTEW